VERVGGKTAILPVVKADAYGHGAVAVARRLESEGAARFAVAIAEEGIALRRGGVAGEILLLNHSDPVDVPLFRAFGLTPSLYDLVQAKGLAEAAAGHAEPLAVHLKLDTGMGRMGVRPEDLPALAELLLRAPGLRLTGTFSNFSSADDPASPATDRQMKTMKAALQVLRAAGVFTGLVHVANSAALLTRPDSRCDAVRPGLALYGVLPSESLEGAGLTPAMTLETRVISIRMVPAGTPLGYGERFVTARPSRIAILPIGYHDGLRRAFSGRVSVLLQGGEAPIVGAVSMDLTLVDATETGAEPGDRAVCLGSEGIRRVTAWDLARAAGTIPYEILCGIGVRVPRVFLG
jgi:alanine racemase